MKNLITSYFLIAILFGAMFFTSCQDDMSAPDVTTSTEQDNNAYLPEGELITLKSGAEVIKTEIGYFFEGDILLPEEQLRRLDETGSIYPETIEPIDSSRIIYINNPSTGVEFIYENQVQTDGTVQTKAFGKHYQLGPIWSMVRYVLAPDLSYNNKTAFLQAKQVWEKSTNVRFYDSTGEVQKHPVYGFEYPYLYVMNSDIKNVSYCEGVGRKGGKQKLAIYSTYFPNTGSAIHEIGHAIGLYHEHTRPDRDRYVTVNYGNMENDRNTYAQFNKITTNYYMIGTFDWNSIMLYSSYAFTKNGKPTMTKKNGNTFYGQRSNLSEMDRRWANTFYLPYVERDDICLQLEKTVYKGNNTIMNEYERRNLMYQLNQNRGNCYYQVSKW